MKTYRGIAIFNFGNDVIDLIFIIVTLLGHLLSPVMRNLFLEICLSSNVRPEILSRLIFLECFHERASVLGPCAPLLVPILSTASPVGRPHFLSVVVVRVSEVPAPRVRSAAFVCVRFLFKVFGAPPVDALPELRVGLLLVVFELPDLVSRQRL
jgi:hypothetical protein